MVSCMSEGSNILYLLKSMVYTILFVGMVAYVPAFIGGVVYFQWKYLYRSQWRSCAMNVFIFCVGIVEHLSVKVMMMIHNSCLV